jgi:glycosyltransferase involved in cell wall biosynthesis
LEGVFGVDLKNGSDNRRWFGLRDLAARVFRRPASARPTISVVVPFRDVEAYLEECLLSILAQRIKGMELVLIDDGSTDLSRSIALRVTAGFPSVRLLHTAGEGPGVARNAGLAAATGTYFTFVDSDDVLPAGALKSMLDSANSNDADIVVGPLGRFNKSRRWHPRWIGDVHLVVREGITAAEFPAVLRNNYGCGKLYRRAYWDEQGLKFEEAMIYEDQPIIGQMLWRATRLNILDTISYSYRARDDRSSVSQRPEELRDLNARVEAWRRTLQALRTDEQPPAVVAGWYRTLYQTHFHWYLRSAGIAEVPYWEVLRAAYLELAPQCPAGVLASLHPSQRIPLLLLAEDRREQLVELNAASGLGRGVLSGSGEVRVASGSLPAHFDGYDGDPYLIAVDSLAIQAFVIRGHWQRDSTGVRLVAEIGLKCPDELAVEDISLRLETADGQLVAELPLVDVAADEWAGLQQVLGIQRLVSAVIDTAHIGSEEVLIWLGRGSRAQIPVSRLSRAGGAGELGTVAIGSAGDLRLAGGHNNHAPVRLIPTEVSSPVTEVRIFGRSVELAITDKGARPEFIGWRSTLGEVLRAKVAWRGDLGTARIELPARRVDQEMVSWQARGLLAGGAKVSLRWPTGRANPNGCQVSGELVALSNAAGVVTVEEYPDGFVLGHQVREGVLKGVFSSSAGLTEVSVGLKDISEVGTIDAALFGLTGQLPVLAAPALLSTLPQVISADSEVLILRARRRRLTVERTNSEPLVSAE